MIHHLHVLKQDLDITNMFDATIWAVACIAFWSQCRLAEVCVDLAFDPKVHTSRSSPLKSGFTANGVEFGGFFAPSTKTQTMWQMDLLDGFWLRVQHSHRFPKSPAP